MPIYEYEILNEDGSPKGIFETTQKMSEPALTRHPATGEPMRRILSRTFVGSMATTDAGGCATGTCGVPSGGCSSGSCGWD